MNTLAKKAADSLKLYLADVILTQMTLVLLEKTKYTVKYNLKSNIFSR